MRFSAELKQAALQTLAELKWGKDRFAEAVGLAPSVLYRWVKQQGVATRQKRGRLTRVQVVPTPKVEKEGSLVLEVGNGARVRGLTVEQLARLLAVTK